MIRVFNETDMEGLIEIINKGYTIKEENFIKEIKDPDKKIFVYDDGKIKGFAYVETYNEESLEFMLNVYVEPKERGSGIGKALYEEAYKFLEKLNPNTLITMFKVEEDDGAFYKRLGFKKWYGCYNMCYKGAIQPESDMKFVPYEDKYYELFVKSRQEGFYELRKENNIKPYVAVQPSERDRKKSLDIKDCIYLAFDEDKLIAVAHIEGNSIERIIVTPDYRGMGYGRKTTQFAINKGLNNSNERVCLDVVESNIKAINLYKSLGFEVHQNDHLYILMI